MFDDLNEIINKAFTYTPLTEEGLQASYVNDVQEWAETVSSEWDGDNAGRLEDRAHVANDIVYKCKELKELLREMEQL